MSTHTFLMKMMFPNDTNLLSPNVLTVIIKAYINVEDYQDREIMFCAEGMDLASTGRDYTANYNLICLENVKFLK